MSKVTEMLENPNIRKWFDDFTYNNTDRTAHIYLRRLSAILESIGEDPDSILELDKEILYEKMFTFAKKEKKRKLAPAYIVSEFRSIYSYLNQMDVNYKRIPSPKNVTSTPTLVDEQIPTKNELSNLLDTSDLRSRVMISLMAFTGIRPGVIGDELGRDGLKMGDLSGWEIIDGEITFDIPTMITVRPELSKTSKKYLTFMCEEGSIHLKNYIESRIRNEEKITMRSPVVISAFRNHHDHIETNSISVRIKSSMKKIGMNKRPYVLRRYFASRLQEAESNGLIIHSYNQFMMGHAGDMMARYTLSKGLTDIQLIDMREAYQRSQKYLQTDSSISQDEIDATHERMNEIETKSQITQEALFEQISTLKKQIDKQNVIINLLVTEKKKTFHAVSDYIKDNLEPDDHGPMIINKYID